MLKMIKRIAAVLLVVCLFLPLSQCTQAPRPTDTQQQPVVYLRYAVDICPFIKVAHCPEVPASEQISKERWVQLLFGLPFLLPLIMVLFHFKTQYEKLRFELLDVFCALLAWIVVSLHFISGGQLLLGAYLAEGASLTYLFASIAESFMTIKNRCRKRS